MSQRITTSRRSVFRGCRYSLMFRPPSLLSPQIVPTAAPTAAGQPGILLPGLSCFVTSTRTGYANRLTQAIDGTGTLTLSDSQPCRLLTSLHGHYPASSLLQGSPPLSGASVLSASRLEPSCAFSLSIAGQVLTFHTRARLSFAPPTCRMPLGPSQCIPQAYPERWVSPRF